MSIVTAATAELSISLAMDPYFVDMPDVLVGTINRAGEENVKIVHEPVAEAEPEEDMIISVTEDAILEDVTTGELNEVICFTENAEGMVSVLVRGEDGAMSYVAESDWAYFYGEAGEIELMGTYDRASMLKLRAEFGITPAELAQVDGINKVMGRV